jgi:hypothetical protein
LPVSISADEDTRGGFEYGGWAAARNDETMGAKVGERMRGEHAFLFGRRSYEDVLQAWNRMGGPYSDIRPPRPNSNSAQPGTS